MKKTLSLVLAVMLLAGVVVSCNRSQSAATTGPASLEMVIMNGDITSLDPSQIVGVSDGNVNLALFEGLAGYDPKTAKAAPGVAESWSYSNNNTVLTFRLRQGVTWSDGTPINAQTFVDSWLYHLNPTTGSEYAYLMGMVVKGAEDYNEGDGRPEDVGIRAVDERTFEVTLVGPLPYALDMMAHWAFNPLPLHVIQRYGLQWTRPENFVGNGPFVVSEHIPNSRTVVVPNERYWNRANVFLTKIIFDATSDANTMYQAYLTGEADWSTGVPLAMIDEIKLNKDYQVAPYLGVYYYIINNVNHVGLNDARVRKALSMAIDRDELVNNITRSGQLPATAFVPPMNDYVPAAGNGYNLTEARRLLAEAGYPNGQGLPTWEFVYNTGDGQRIIAEYIQQQWRNSLGVNITLRNVEWASYLSFRNTPEMQIARGSWIADYMDPQNFLDLFVTGNTANRSKYSDPEVDRLINQSMTLPDGPERNRLMREAEEIAITRDQAVIPLYYNTSGNMIDLTKWDGWYTNPQDMHPYVGIKLK
ncbi:MAG: peptide ABC transporter substrate-binding protein [Treponema sp.]|jgi:oligopeptide transport system substrate-binding protein|nr:peptide ABC transporter substrate-binding protein [Treponema sp.]